MGRDVIAYKGDPNTNPPWVNYQGKHYDAPLTPSEVYVELGKLCYYTFIGEFSIPERYFFAAPKGVGTKLSQLIKKPDKLRQQLIENWDDKCSKKITKTKEVELIGAFRTHVENFDFSILGVFPTLKAVEEHSQTIWHPARFQTGLPSRGPNLTPPATIDDSLETRYVRQLLDAYSDCLSLPIADVGVLTTASALHAGHLQRSREQFYSAESLRNFSRDTLPSGVFEKLQDEVHDGVIDTTVSIHSNAFQRVVATINFARLLPLNSNPLFPRMEVNDKAGICHQLANEERLKWVM